MVSNRNEWVRFMNRKPKKEKKIKSVSDTPIERVHISGDHDLFVELCAAEETIKNLRLEITKLKENYNGSRGSFTIPQQEYFTYYPINSDTITGSQHISITNDAHLTNRS